MHVHPAVKLVLSAASLLFVVDGLACGFENVYK